VATRLFLPQERKSRLAVQADVDVTWLVVLSTGLACVSTFKALPWFSRTIARVAKRTSINAGGRLRVKQVQELRSCQLWKTGGTKLAIAWGACLAWVLAADVREHLVVYHVDAVEEVLVVVDVDNKGNRADKLVVLRILNFEEQLYPAVKSFRVLLEGMLVLDVVAIEGAEVSH